MNDTTYIAARGLKAALTFLNNISTELASPATQKVINLKSRSMPDSPTPALTDSLNGVETFLVAQAATAIQDQIDSLQASFDSLKDESVLTS